MPAGELVCPACGEPAVPAERKVVTVLFADLAGYTALAASMDPEEVFGAIRPWMTGLRLIVEEHGGTVPQVMGDGFMAVFGAPVAHEDDAERAVRAGLALVRHGHRLRIEDDPAFPGLHVGINTGEVIVGGSRESSGFVVVGDVVNISARLADMAAAGHVLVGAATRDLARGRIRYGRRQVRVVKGKAEPVPVYEAVGLQERVRSGSGSPKKADVAQVRVGPFVDRAAVLRRLSMELDRVARTGVARVRVVVDEPGVGKSRLVEELARRRSDALVMRGACLPYGQRLPLAALAEAITEQLGIRGDWSPARVRRAIAALRDSPAGDVSGPAIEGHLLALLGLQSGDDGEEEPPHGPGRPAIDARSAVRPLVRAIARGRSVVIILDDLHWADPDLVAFLHEVNAAPWSDPVLFLALARPEPEDRHRGLPLLRMGGLPRSEAARILRATIGGDLPEEVVRRLVERAAGNPLFLEESARMLVERGALVRVGTSWALADRASLEIVPTGLRLLVAARLDGLPAVEKRALQDASIAGAVTWQELVERLRQARGATDRSAASAVGDALASLIARDLLRRRPVSSIRGASELEFKHVVIRDVAYESMPRAARADGHRVAAEWMRSNSAGSAVAALAHHYERAWELGRSRTRPAPDGTVAGLAAHYLLRWGDDVFAVQPRLAEGLYARGLHVAEVAPEAVDLEVLAGLLIGRAESLGELGRHREAIAAAQLGLDKATGDGPSDTHGLALLALARAYSNLGEVARARGLIGEARAVFEATGNLLGQAQTAHRLAEASRFDDFRGEIDSYRRAYGLYGRARARAEQAMVAEDLAYLLTVVGGSEFRHWFERADRFVTASGDERGRAALHRAWAYAAWYRGALDEALAAAREARPLAADAGDRWIEVDSLLVEALVTASAGAPGEAEIRVAELLAIADLAGARHLRGLVLLCGARPAQRTGHPVRAARRASAARRILVNLGVAMELAEVDLTVAALHLERGAWDRVAAPAWEGERRARANGWRLLVPHGPLLRGRAHLGAGRLAEASHELQRAARLARSLDMPGPLALAEACLAELAALGDGVGPVVGRVVSSVVGGPLGLREAAAIGHEAEGLRAHRDGDMPAAVSAFQTAVRSWHGLGLSVWEARAELFRASALEQRSRGDAARAARRRAAGILGAIRTPPAVAADLGDQAARLSAAWAGRTQR